MKNVTITLDEKVAQWARVEAAKAGKSLSRWIGQRLTTDMVSGRTQTVGLEAPLALPLARLTDGGKDHGKGPADDEDPVAALRRFLAGPGWPGVAGKLPNRDQIHDRPALRRHEHPDLRHGSQGAGKTRKRG